MLEIFNRDRQRVAIAENAFDVSEDRKINAIWYLYFSLPYGDPKNEYCQPFWYVRWDQGELYRIMPDSVSVEETGEISYECEHVLATLIDNVLYGYHVVGNLGVYTADCINYVLAHQLTENWVLYECDFTRQFEYGWEQETLLSALFSITDPLSDYIWVTDTSVYPWRLSLKALDTDPPELHIRYRHNMESYQRDRDPQQICTRLYPLGYGEGVNQLTIKSVNDGVEYLQSPQSYVDKYGIIERIWIDRRYEDAESLKAAAQAMLEELQEPTVEYSVSFAQLKEGDQQQAQIGKRVRIHKPESREWVDTYITELKLSYDEIEKSTLKIANSSTDIASTVADMADRQRIEQSYSQGATQLYAQNLQANCDSENGAGMNFYLPEDMRIINKIMCKVKMGQFRSYSKATETEKSSVQTTTSTESSEVTSTAGGGTYTSTGSGGGTQTTTGSGGGTYTSTGSGGGTYTSTGSGGGVTSTTESKAAETITSTAKVLSAENITPEDSSKYSAAVHNHGIEKGVLLAVYDASAENKIGGYVGWTPSGAHSHGEHSHNLTIPAHSHSFTLQNHSHTINISDHSHSVSIPEHSHSVDIPEHSHSVSVSDHSHNVTIPGHSHDVSIPAHSHEITPGIFFSGDAKSFGLYVGGTLRQSITGTEAELELTDYLVDSSSGTIPRGQWLELEIRPDDLAYVSIDLYVQGFVQSRGDQTV